jgi:hypothetical protein
MANAEMQQTADAAALSSGAAGGLDFPKWSLLDSPASRSAVSSFRGLISMDPDNDWREPRRSTAKELQTVCNWLYGVVAVLVILFLLWQFAPAH